MICNGFYGCCGVVGIGCATDELWSTPDHKRNEHDPKQRVGEVLPKFWFGVGIPFCKSLLLQGGNSGQILFVYLTLCCAICHSLFVTV